MRSLLSHVETVAVFSFCLFVHLNIISKKATISTYPHISTVFAKYFMIEMFPIMMDENETGVTPRRMRRLDLLVSRTSAQRQRDISRNL